ncbi:hypothetical protein F9K07_11865 [Hydrogenophaga sp. BPS33]|nr:hypothetical protein F9K07_11865 [Hydrogenophaga sp. BPS33]
MSVIDKLNYQPGFRIAVWDYLAGWVDDQRAADGQAMPVLHAETLQRVQERYGVATSTARTTRAGSRRRSPSLPDRVCPPPTKSDATVSHFFVERASGTAAMELIGRVCCRTKTVQAQHTSRSRPCPSPFLRAFNRRPTRWWQRTTLLHPPRHPQRCRPGRSWPGGRKNWRRSH